MPSLKCIAQVRKERLDILLAHCPVGYSPVKFAQEVLGSKATYLSDIAHMTDEDLATVWAEVTSYSREREWILEILKGRRDDATMSGLSFRSSEISRLIDTIATCTATQIYPS